MTQPSGAELEYLNFCQALASAPFFATSLKTRVARLSRFTHASYCRVRRVQPAADLDWPIALVSTHVAGRRLAELLDVAARAGLKPATGGILSLTRQTMTAVALLHDFAPDGFHGALGPDRLILAGDGRVVIAEHVLGTVVEQAVEAWGVPRLWQDFGIATLPDTRQAQYGRRVDVLQIGLTALALLLGRPLDATAFPDGLGQLLGEVSETQPDGTSRPLSRGLRDWLERTLVLKKGESAFETLLESQKALGQLAQDEHNGASPAAWDAFVRACETAAVRVPLVVVVPEPTDAPSVPVAASADGSAQEEPGQTKATGEGVLGVAADPFGPWPVAVPAESAATLLDTFLSAPPPAEPAAPARGPASAGTGKRASDPWASAKASPIHPEPLFEAPKVEPAPAATVASDIRTPPQPTTVADWQPPEPSVSPTAVPQRASVPERPSAGGEARARFKRPPDSRRWVRLLVIAVLAGLATAGAVHAPAIWLAAYETFRTFGTVTVESDPPGALITVDGQMRGHAPASLRLEPGEHLVEVQAGGSAKSKRITLAPRAKMTEKFTLPEAGERGGFRITTYPLPARITIDGKFRGDAPVKVTDLTPGTHTLLAETRLGSQEQDVIAQPGVVLQLAVPTASWVKVTAPYDLNVHEAGRLLGTTGNEPVLVRPGRHHLEFVNQELGLKLRQFIDAAPGQVVTVPLELPTGMINLFSDQPAEVFVDGERVGETPLSSLQVSLGPHQVVARHPRYGEVRYTVRVTLAAPVELRVTFRK